MFFQLELSSQLELESFVSFMRGSLYFFERPLVNEEHRPFENFDGAGFVNRTVGPTALELVCLLTTIIKTGRRAVRTTLIALRLG